MGQRKYNNLEIVENEQKKTERRRRRKKPSSIPSDDDRDVKLKDVENFLPSNALTALRGTSDSEEQYKILFNVAANMIDGIIEKRLEENAAVQSATLQATDGICCSKVVPTAPSSTRKLHSILSEVTEEIAAEVEDIWETLANENESISVINGYQCKTDNLQTLEGTRGKIPKHCK